jgi:hypothetical protein
MNRIIVFYDDNVDVADLKETLKYELDTFGISNFEIMFFHDFRSYKEEIDHSDEVLLLTTDLVGAIDQGEKIVKEIKSKNPQIITASIDVCLPLEGEMYTDFYLGPTLVHGIDFMRNLHRDLKKY